MGQSWDPCDMNQPMNGYNKSLNSLQALNMLKPYATDLRIAHSFQCVVGQQSPHMSSMRTHIMCSYDVII